MELSGLLMAAAKPARVAMAAALLFLFTPRTFLVLEQGWTESYAVLAIALAVFVAIRIPRAIPVAVGLTLATKQYLVFVLPFALLFFADDWKSRTLLALRSIAIAAAVSLPLILWNVPDFMNSAVIMFLNLPFRPDSLSPNPPIRRGIDRLSAHGDGSDAMRGVVAGPGALRPPKFEGQRPLMTVTGRPTRTLGRRANPECSGQARDGAQASQRLTEVELPRPARR